MLNMKKVLNVYELDCAHCAAKMESAINKLPSVQNCNINIFQQKMALEIDDTSYDSTIKQIKKIVHQVEPDCSIEE